MSFKDFSLTWTRSAEKSLNNLPHNDQQKILKKVDSLTKSEHLLDIKKLTGCNDINFFCEVLFLLLSRQQIHACQASYRVSLLNGRGCNHMDDVHIRVGNTF